MPFQRFSFDYRNLDMDMDMDLEIGLSVERIFLAIDIHRA